MLGLASAVCVAAWKCTTARCDAGQFGWFAGASIVPAWQASSHGPPPHLARCWRCPFAAVSMGAVTAAAARPPCQTVFQTGTRHLAFCVTLLSPSCPQPEPYPSSGLAFLPFPPALSPGLLAGRHSFGRPSNTPRPRSSHTRPRVLPRPALNSATFIQHGHGPLTHPLQPRPSPTAHRSLLAH